MNSYVCKGEFTLGEYVKPDLHFLAVEKVLSIGHFKASCQDEESFDEGPYATHSTGDCHDGDLEDAQKTLRKHKKKLQETKRVLDDTVAAAAAARHATHC